MSKCMVGILCVVLLCGGVSCTDKTEAFDSVFDDATFMLEPASDTLNLYGPGARNVYIYYGQGMLDTYNTSVLWSTANWRLLSVAPNGKYVIGDSCFAVASVTPKEGDGSTTITATLTDSEGRQRSLSLTVMIDGMRGDSRWSILPDGFITDTVGSTIFAMAYIKADTCIDVGERWGIDHDTTYWNDRNYTQSKKDSLYKVWHHQYYDVWKWNADNVHIEDFYLGQVKVTTGLWKEIMGYNPNAVEGALWNQNKYNYNLMARCWSEEKIGKRFWSYSYPVIMDFLEKLRERTGLPYRLPTHAEWQFVAEGGRRSKGYRLIGSNDVDEIFWMAKNTNNPFAVMPEVTQKKPNELGLYGMQGSLGELCSDLVYKQYITNYKSVEKRDGKYLYAAVPDTLPGHPVLGGIKGARSWRPLAFPNFLLESDTTLTRKLIYRDGTEFVGQDFQNGGWCTLRLALSVKDYKKAKGIK